jgi:serine/threonine-protein kinase HipA
VRRGLVLNHGRVAGTLEEVGRGFRFTYDPAYLADPANPPVSLTLPRQPEPFEAAHLFAFFVGLLAEGSAKDIQCRRLKLDADDHFGRLLATCAGDVIGSVTVIPVGGGDEAGA